MFNHADCLVLVVSLCAQACQTEERGFLPFPSGGKKVWMVDAHVFEALAPEDQGLGVPELLRMATPELWANVKGYFEDER